MRYLTIAGLLFLLVGGSGASGAAGAAPVVDLRVPPFPQDLDLRSVERLYKSAAFKVAVRRHAAKADANANVFKQTFVFETRNGWVIHDYFNKNPNRRRDVLSPAERVGHTPNLPAHVNAAKADLQTASFTQFSFANTAVDVRITLLGADARAQHVTVRPQRLAVPARISADGRVISFTRDRPRKTDGIWVTGNYNVVDDVFIFNNDDAFVSKGGRNTAFSNAVFWGGKQGMAPLVTTERRLPELPELPRPTAVLMSVRAAHSARPAAAPRMRC